MKFFLASEAKHPESMSKLQEFVGGFEGKSIAYIPTAANGENPYGEWRTESGSWKLVQTLGAQVAPVVLEEYRNASVIEMLKGKDILWFAGGSASYLMYWIRRCGVDAALPNLLNEGSIYVGSSAGSMITAPTLTLAEWYIGEPERGARDMRGLGFVDFEIYPHYDEALLPEIKKQWDGTTMYLLKNGEAITVVDGKATVLGEERVLLKEI